jgi:hypothetical protein
LEKDITESYKIDILTTALEITSQRLKTTKNSEYISRKFSIFQELEQYQQNITHHYPANLTGILSESLFYKVYSQVLGEENITIATGEEDMQGIDFYINEYPIDVTSSSHYLTKKISTVRVPTIFLPNHIQQQSIHEKTSYNYETNYIMQAIHMNKINCNQYIQDTYNINKDIYQQIEQNPNLAPEAGVNNITNMKVILGILD